MSPRKKQSSENAFEAYLLRLYKSKNKSVQINKRKQPAVVDEFEQKVIELVKGKAIPA